MAEVTQGPKRTISIQPDNPISWLPHLTPKQDWQNVSRIPLYRYL